MENCNKKRKRVGDESPDSESDSPESETRNLVDSPGSKILRVNSDHIVDSAESQLTRVDSVESYPDSVFDSDVNLQDDILNILDDNDNVPERDSVQGLDSVIKSFEEEILAQGSDPGQVATDPEPVLNSGEMQANLGYLLEASDDELGLPPTVTPGEEPGRVGPEGADLTGFMGFEDDIPGYDGFGFGTGLLAECDGDGGFVTVDGLFECAEPAADVLWRSESLQAM